ncbi:MAG: alkaline phosphatase family protein [Acidimicrobiia bacterium]|nr:alkaline phosphatase family protein [Acidimicrobiia bacterium]
MGQQPVIPRYGGPCVANLVPALLGQHEAPHDWLPAEVDGAAQIVLLVLDGLGWEQLCLRSDVAPTLVGLAGGPIDTVCPTTTSTALTSITTGLPPGQHGIIGYRMAVEGEVLNVLRWTVDGRDVRERITPEKLQHHEPFCSERPPVVTRTEFRDSGFTRAHLDGVRFNGYRMLSTLSAETARLAAGNEPFIYAYYDGLDKVAHEYGLGAHYTAELRSIDDFVAGLIEELPSETALVLTADHGHVDVGENTVPLGPELQSHVELLSGEGRFRWLHAAAGHERELFEAATALHSDTGWVASREQVLDEEWFGPTSTSSSVARMGSVALVARDDVAYLDPADTGPYVLLGRHGGLTAAEVRVPLLVART